MASDSSEDELDNWVFYRDREEWRDVTPIEQDDGPFPVVAIAYTDKCKSLLACNVGIIVLVVLQYVAKFQYPDRKFLSLKPNLKRKVRMIFRCVMNYLV